MYRAPLNADEYCCVSFVSTELADEHPDIAAAFTRAVLKASAYVTAYPEETAKIQIKGEYVRGDPEFNAEILKSYKYIRYTANDASFVKVEYTANTSLKVAAQMKDCCG